MRDNTKTEMAIKAIKEMLKESGEKIIFKTQDFYALLPKLGLEPGTNTWVIDRVLNILIYNGNIRRVQKGLYEKTNYGYGKKW
jgi:hypothetical protein